MLWDILLGYLVATSVVVPIYLVSTLFVECPGQVRMKDQPRMIQIISLLISLLAGVLLGSLIFPFLAYAFWVCFRDQSQNVKYWNSIRRSHFPMCFDPIHRANIDEELWSYMEEESAVLNAMDYQTLGEFWTKGEPFNTKQRIEISADNMTISGIGQLLDVKFCTLSSFLEDGSVISSANCPELDIEKQLAANNYFCFCDPNADMLSLHEQHVAAVSRLSAERGVAIEQIPTARWREYMTFLNDRFGQIKFEIGKGDAPVEASYPTQIIEEKCDLGLVAVDDFVSTNSH